MNSGILLDMWRGFTAQFRRTFWGAILLWFGMSLATVAVIAGYGLSTTTLTRIANRLPGDLDSLLYVDTGAYGSPPTQGPRWNGFNVAFLEEIRKTGMVSAYFFRIPGRSVIVDGSQLPTDFIVYAGRPPLYGGTIADVLEKIASTGDIAVNHGLAKALAERHLEGKPLLLYPGDDRLPAAVVGLSAALDPGHTLFVPAETAHRTANAYEVGLYLSPGTDAATLSAWLSDRISREYPTLQVKTTSGRERHDQQLREARQVSLMALGGALLVLIVAFVNAGNLLSLWILNRAHGLRLRRLLGAPPTLIMFYMLFDLLCLASFATLTGLGFSLIVRLMADETFVGLLITGEGAVAALAVMLLATTLVGFIMNKALQRYERQSAIGAKL
jgi:hypothetical protein